jgi:hypothetical protein
MSIRKDYPGTKGKREYLREVLECYHSNDRVMKLSQKGWTGVGKRMDRRALSALIVSLLILSFLLIMFPVETLSERMGVLMYVAFIVCMPLLVVLVFLYLPLSEKKDGWYRSFEASLTDSLEAVYRSLIKASFKVEVFKCDTSSTFYGARAAIFDIPRRGLTLTVWKDKSDQRRTNALLETQHVFDMHDAEVIMSIIDGMVLQERS